MPPQKQKDEGQNHQVQCTAILDSGEECEVWTDIWIPKKISKEYRERLAKDDFYCGFCAAAKIAQMKEELVYANISLSDRVTSLEHAKANVTQPMTSNPTGPTATEPLLRNVLRNTEWA